MLFAEFSTILRTGEMEIFNLEKRELKRNAFFVQRN